MQRMLWVLVFCFGVSSLGFSQEAASTDATKQRELDVVFVNPSSPDDDFWRSFEKFMAAAAEDLNINLEVMYSARGREPMLENVRAVARRSVKPDAIVFQSLKQNGAEAIAISNQAEIPAFLVNAGVDYAETGNPREKYPYWIGELLPDDEQAGYDMARLLVATAQAVGLADANGVVNILALEGTRSDGASIARVKGLQRALSELDNVHLEQVVTANWSQDVAAQKFYWLYGRYPDTHVVWCASDGMALGVIEKARELDILSSDNTDGRELDLLVGGVDWIVPAREAVSSKDLLLTMGGHFMDGARTLVLLRDYFDGIDFADDTTLMTSRHTPLSSVNIQAYDDYLGNADNWHDIDFQQFSKSYNPESAIVGYPFTLDTLLAQFVDEEQSEAEQTP